MTADHPTTAPDSPGTPCARCGVAGGHLGPWECHVCARPGGPCCGRLQHVAGPWEVWLCPECLTAAGQYGGYIRVLRAVHEAWRAAARAARGKGGES